MYAIYARIENEEHLLESSIPEEELEGSLQNLTRKQEFKNVTRFEIREQCVCPDSPTSKRLTQTETY